MTDRQLRWGVLGTAHIADQLVRAFTLSSNSALVAIASRDLARAEAWARARSVPHIFGSYPALLASDEVDAIYIPLPNSLHTEWTIEAARCGKHVLCEKPLATSAAEVEQIMRAADESGVRVMEAFMYRFHPQTLEFVRRLAGGAVGEIRLLRASFGFYLQNPSDIRLSAELAGGSLMDLGCYAVNAARLITGQEPVAVQASAVWAASGVDESLSGLLEFPDGTLAVIDSSFAVAMHQWLGVSGTHGHLGVIHPFRMNEEPQHLLYEHDGQSETIPVPGANEYQTMVDHFASAVLQDQPVAYTLKNSLGNMRVIEALYQAVRSGRRIVL